MQRSGYTILGLRLFFVSGTVSPQAKVTSTTPYLLVLQVVSGTVSPQAKVAFCVISAARMPHGLCRIKSVRAAFPAKMLAIIVNEFSKLVSLCSLQSTGGQ